MPGGLAPLMSSAKGDWQTPENVRAVVHALFATRHGVRMLDPCTAPENPMQADRFYTENGLDEHWTCCDTVYCNPPYGRGIGEWVDKCGWEGRRLRGVVALLPARTDTRWFPWDARALCFWKGRLTFVGAPAPAPFPSVLAFWGADQGMEQQFCELTARHGRVVRP